MGNQEQIKKCANVTTEITEWVVAHKENRLVNSFIRERERWFVSKLDETDETIHPMKERKYVCGIVNELQNKEI